MIFIIEIFILWLFPDSGFFPGVLPWLITISLTLFMCFVFYRVIIRNTKNWIIAFVFLTLLTSQTMLQLWAISKNTDGDSFSRISDATNAYYNYDKIQFDSFPNLSTGERVVFVYKFKNILPDTLYIFTIDSLKDQSVSTNSRTYLIQRINNELVFDKAKLSIVERDTATLIVEYHKKRDTLKYKMIPNFFKDGGSGYNDRIISLTSQSASFELTSGIEKLLYYALSEADKPTAKKS